MWVIPFPLLLAGQWVRWFVRSLVVPCLPNECSRSNHFVVQPTVLTYTYVTASAKVVLYKAKTDDAHTLIGARHRQSRSSRSSNSQLTNSFEAAWHRTALLIRTELLLLLLYREFFPFLHAPNKPQSTHAR